MAICSVMMELRSACRCLPGVMLLVVGFVREAACEPLDLSGTTDDSIRNVITVVADRFLLVPR